MIYARPSCLLAVLLASTPALAVPMAPEKSVTPGSIWWSDYSEHPMKVSILPDVLVVLD